MWEILINILTEYGPELALAAGAALGATVTWQKRIKMAMKYAVIPVIAEVIEAKAEGKDIVAADLIKEVMDRVLAHEGINTATVVGKSIAKSAIKEIVMTEALEKTHKIKSHVDLLASANKIGASAVMEGDRVKVGVGTFVDPRSGRIKWKGNAKIKLF